MKDGWIKIHRKLLEWEWYSDTNTFRLFMHLLLAANYENKEWQGITVLRGQLVTGRKILSIQTKLNEQVVRTCLTRLISTNEITIKSTSKFSIITICKYDDYQTIENMANHQINQQDNQQLTNNQPATNQQLTTTKEIKKERSKEIKNKEYLAPSLDEVKIYFKENGYREDVAIKMFNYYSVANWKDSKGNKVKSWKQKSQIVWFTDENKIQNFNPKTQIPSEKELLKPEYR
jgi:hypothetical protein